jgi:hypothetical protein
MLSLNPRWMITACHRSLAAGMILPRLWLLFALKCIGAALDAVPWGDSCW